MEPPPPSSAVHDFSFWMFRMVFKSRISLPGIFVVVYAVYNSRAFMFWWSLLALPWYLNSNIRYKVITQYCTSSYPILGVFIYYLFFPASGDAWGQQFSCHCLFWYCRPNGHEVSNNCPYRLTAVIWREPCFRRGMIAPFAQAGNRTRAACVAVEHSTSVIDTSLKQGENTRCIPDFLVFLQVLVAVCVWLFRTEGIWW